MKISLLGKASGWKLAGRHNCCPGEVWGLNTHIFERTYDRVFEIHTRDNFNKRVSLDAQDAFFTLLNKNNTPLVVINRSHWTEVKNVEEFPFNKIFNYFQSSFDYMISYAILYGATEIQLFGCKVIKGGSHEFARPCIEFWLGYAISCGIRLTIYQPSDLLKLENSVLYGCNTQSFVVEQIRFKAPA